MTDHRNALAAREAIEAQHPEITITTPLTSRSRQWELYAQGEVVQFDDFWFLVDHLAARFGDIEPATADG